eukprot:6782523-Pyramimonas_sp.AAC.1
MPGMATSSPTFHRRHRDGGRMAAPRRGLGLPLNLLCPAQRWRQVEAPLGIGADVDAVEDP